MNHGKNNKGFSGLSSLTSDIDHTIADSRRRNVQGEKSVARGRNKNEQQPRSQKPAAMPMSAVPQHSEPEAIVPSTSRTSVSDGKDKRGFSALSSLASHVDETVSDSTRRNVQEEEPIARGRDKDEQQPHRRHSREKASPAPPRKAETEQEVVASGTSRTPASGSLGVIWFCGLVGLGVLIWFSYDAREDSRKPSTVPSYVQPSPSPNYRLSNTPEAQITGLEFSKPAVGENNILSVAQIRWCLREGIRIEVLRPMPTTNSQIDQFNAVVADYNSRCGSYRYRERTLTRAQQDVERARAQIVASVSPPW